MPIQLGASRLWGRPSNAAVASCSLPSAAHSARVTQCERGKQRSSPTTASRWPKRFGRRSNVHYSPTHSYAHTCTDTHMHAHARTCTHMHAHARAYKYIHAHTRTYTHIRAHSHAHTRTHTHTPHHTTRTYTFNKAHLRHHRHIPGPFFSFVHSKAFTNVSIRLCNVDDLSRDAVDGDDGEPGRGTVAGPARPASSPRFIASCMMYACIDRPLLRASCNGVCSVACRRKARTVRQSARDE